MIAKVKSALAAAYVSTPRVSGNPLLHRRWIVGRRRTGQAGPHGIVGASSIAKIAWRDR